MRTDDEQPRQQRVLEDWGGWLLIAFGVALVVLAALFADEAAVAPIFAFTGVAMVVIGAIFHRLEGLELSTGSLKLTLRKLFARDDLTLEEKGEAASEILEGRTPQVARSRKPRIAGWPPGTGRVAFRAHVFEEAVEMYLRDQGWAVERTPRTGRDRAIDFVASRSGDQMIVEARGYRHLGRADFGQIVAALEAAVEEDFPNARMAIALPRGAKVTSASRGFLAQHKVELIEVGLGDLDD